MKWEASAPGEVSYYRLGCDEGRTHVEFQTSFVRTAGFKLGMLRHIKVRCMVIGKPI